MSEYKSKQSAFTGPDRVGDESNKYAVARENRKEAEALTDEDLVRFFEEYKSNAKSAEYKNSRERDVIKRKEVFNDPDITSEEVESVRERMKTGDLATVEEELGYEHLRDFCVRQLNKRVGVLLKELAETTEAERKPLTNLQLKMLKLFHSEDEHGKGLTDYAHDFE